MEIEMLDCFLMAWIYLSVITEFELFGKPGLSVRENDYIEVLLSVCFVIDIKGMLEKSFSLPMLLFLFFSRTKIQLWVEFTSGCSPFISRSVMKIKVIKRFVFPQKIIKI
jgi:hypothetical protein